MFNRHHICGCMMLLGKTSWRNKRVYLVICFLVENIIGNCGICYILSFLWQYSLDYIYEILNPRKPFYSSSLLFQLLLIYTQYGSNKKMKFSSQPYGLGPSLTAQLFWQVPSTIAGVKQSFVNVDFIGRNWKTLIIFGCIFVFSLLIKTWQPVLVCWCPYYLSVQQERSIEQVPNLKQ